MAIIKPTPITTGNSSIVARQWALAGGDVGEKFPFSQYTDKTIHLAGDIGTGIVMTLRGSSLAAPDETNDAHWFTLTDGGLANPIVMSSLGGKVVLESPLWVSPKVTGDAAAALLLTLNGKEGK